MNTNNGFAFVLAVFLLPLQIHFPQFHILVGLLRWEWNQWMRVYSGYMCGFPCPLSFKWVQPMGIPFIDQRREDNWFQGSSLAHISATRAAVVFQESTIPLKTGNIITCFSSVSGAICLLPTFVLMRDKPLIATSHLVISSASKPLEGVHLRMNSPNLSVVPSWSWERIQGV